MGSATDLLFRDFLKVCLILMGLAAGYILAQYHQDRLNFGYKRWQKLIIYLEAIIAVGWIVCYGTNHTPEIIEKGVLFGLSALIGMMLVLGRKETNES